MIFSEEAWDCREDRQVWSCGRNASHAGVRVVSIVGFNHKY